MCDCQAGLTKAIIIIIIIIIIMTYLLTYLVDLNLKIAFAIKATL